MSKQYLLPLLLILMGVFFGYFDYASEAGIRFTGFPFSLGLDLSGGTHLVYDADLSDVLVGQEKDSLDALRDVIERRVNIFGVSEPLVQVEQNVSENGERGGRLIVELPGVTNINEAVALIGITPVLEFKVENQNFNREEVTFNEETGESFYHDKPLLADDLYASAGLTGKHLKNARLEFNSVSGEPVVTLVFNSEGSHIFAELTRDNIGKTIAIYLDGVPITTPVVQDEITGGEAQITGNFTNEEAKLLVGRLNAGALPVPISLLSTQTIGSTLGQEATKEGIKAGLYGFILIALFFMVWYRLPGIFAVISLVFYIVFLLALFKVIPVTLTSAGIAGFILSIGLAVDANVLIFERLREERQKGKNTHDAIHEAFTRAWTSIRDANISSILTAVVLFWFGTSLVKGFALTFGLGVSVSMFTAIIFTKSLMLAFIPHDTPTSTVMKFLLGSGLKK